MPGVPGAGLGGLFYVVLALVGLVVELVATVRGRSSFARWRAVIQQSSLAGGIVLSITLTYSGAKLLFPDTPPETPTQLAAGGTVVEAPARNPLDTASLELLPIAPVLMTVGTLAVLLALTVLLGLALRRRGARDEQAVEPAGRLEPGPQEPSEAIAA